MTKKNYSKYEAKEELVTLSFNHVLLHKKDTKIYQVIFLSLLILTLCFYINVEAQCKSNKSIYGNAISVLYEKLLKDEVLEKTDTLYVKLRTKKTG